MDRSKQDLALNIEASNSSGVAKSLVADEIKNFPDGPPGTEERLRAHLKNKFVHNKIKAINADEGPTMDARHREMININLSALVEKTENIELVIDELIDSETITESMASKIRENNDPARRAEELYLLLPKRGPNAFKALLEAFRVTGNGNVELILKDNRLCNQSPTEGMSPFEDSDGEYEERYRMKTSPRGIVLIVNVFEYDENHRIPRYGSKNDVENLRILFEEMGYEVQEESRGTKTEIESSIINWKDQEKMSRVDCGIIILMAHGTEGPDPGTVRIDTIDKKTIESEWIINHMSSAEAERLHGKPKLIFILTCRGFRPDDGTDLDKLEEIIESQRKTVITEASPFDRSSEYDGFPKVSPSLSDVLLIYPCAPGRASSRDPEFGSWFVQEMCKVFRKKAHKDDVESMLKEMDRNLVKQRQAQIRDSFQIICTTTRGFKRKLFFNPVPSFTNGFS